MLLKETILKTFENFKYLFFKGYQKLQKPISFNPFSCSKGKQESLKTDRLYIDFYDEWQSTLHKASSNRRNDNENVMEMKENNVKQDEADIAKQNHPPKRRQEKAVNDKKKTATARLRKGDIKNNSMRGNGLVQKMKELEVLDRGDMEQELDIEEAIHYYSRLKSPVYLEIVDKFFMDMHSDISIPEPSAGSRNSSKRRMGSMRL